MLQAIVAGLSEKVLSYLAFADISPPSRPFQQRNQHESNPSFEWTYNPNVVYSFGRLKNSNGQFSSQIRNWNGAVRNLLNRSPQRLCQGYGRRNNCDDGGCSHEATAGTLTDPSTKATHESDPLHTGATRKTCSTSSKTGSTSNLSAANETKITTTHTSPLMTMGREAVQAHAAG